MISSTFSFIVILMGFLFSLIGLIIWKKQKITLINGYNNRNVKKEDVKGYTESIGKAYIIMGTTMMILGILGLLNNENYKVVGAIVYMVGVVISIIKFVKTQKKYRTGIWS
ncbi:DUF3784 domain-containing protein [Clostridium cibarium]|uniref:DUF3784 domain-containing protein n=1 Tax=Clostridium cibarium TaxID=2762247 RepID=A0ABR8PV66_9CLOT|nr:DUF3784 domain-containing protein [Clostridium cibarium]MBD7912061.1 DUF3784 domain-containing protein [Clostridium cibarium]